MQIFWTPRFRRDWRRLTAEVRERAVRAAQRLEKDRKHPSLRLKRLRRLPGYWEIRVDDNHRIIMIIEGGTYTFVAIGPYDVLDRF